MATIDIGLEVYGRSDIGRERTHNDDAFVIADLMAGLPVHAMSAPIGLAVGARGVLLAVSDGMGGAQAGDVARVVALQALTRGVATTAASPAAVALTESVKHSDGKVWDVAVGAHPDGAGPTIAVVFLDGPHAFSAEMGETRGYVMRGRRLVRMADDASTVPAVLDSGSLSRQHVESLPYRNVVLQAMGTRAHAVVTMSRVSLLQGDRLLLCSDGLSTKLTEDEVRTIVASTSILDIACRELIALANARGGEDNITVVLAEMRGEGLPAPEGVQDVPRARVTN